MTTTQARIKLRGYPTGTLAFLVSDLRSMLPAVKSNSQQVVRVIAMARLILLQRAARAE